MWRTANRFLLWLPVAAATITAFWVTSLLVAAPIWNGAKLEAEAEWSWLIWAVNTLWIPMAAIIVVAIWLWAFFWTDAKDREARARELPARTNFDVESAPQGIGLGDKVDAEIRRKPPVLAVGLGPDSTAETKTVWLELSNSTDADATDIRARLTDAKPPLFESGRAPLGLPLVLTTKARWDRHRAKVENLPQRPFTVAGGDKKLLPIFQAKRFSPVVAEIISEAGPIQVAFQECELTIEVAGRCDPFRVLISIQSLGGSWRAVLTVEATGKATSRKEGPRASDVAKALGEAADEEDRLTASRLSAILPMDKLGALYGNAGKPKRDKTLSEALAYAAVGQWGRSYQEVMIEMAYSGTGGVVKRFQEAALAGRIHVWGKLSDDGAFKLIPAEHWEARQLNLTDIMGGGAGLVGAADPYRQLWVSRVEIEEEWDHEG